MTTEHQVLTVTDGARDKALRIRARDPDAQRLALWLRVTGVTAGRYDVVMTLDHLDRVTADDVVQHTGDLPVVVPTDSVDALRGARLYLDGDLESGGIALDNPNTPPLPAPPPPLGGDLSGTTAQRLLRVLAEQINPAIASHGGAAELVAVEGTTAYLRLSGGCQGCGMASVTLNQGIVAALREAVPEISDVVDVTDHASGTNPYMTAAKK